MRQGVSASGSPKSIHDGLDHSPSHESSRHGGSVGLSSMAQLGPCRRKMLDIVNKLQSTGVQVDIDIPQIILFGPQSAGKSSTIEGITGMKFPRASGTCTRCPMECRLSHSNLRWQCTVSLRFTVDANGQTLGQVRTQSFGEIIYDKSEVEDRIRRAQRAILNPTKPAQLFLEGLEIEDNDESEQSFSVNAVTLEISGPDVADLSFCDLPGLIASVSSGRGGGNDIGLIESLVTSYIKKPSCIILLTIACETDFENQGAYRLAKQYDPDGKRTVGVLTKPDRIPLGEESNWLQFIKNERETLQNNWFCVKQPSSNDLKGNITWSQARQLENDFFSSTAPWCELDGIYQKYLRTGNLVERLSIILSDLISKRLPQIQNEVERSIIATRLLLARLPPVPTADPRSEISTLLHKFTSDLLQHIQGISNSTRSSGEGVGLMQAIHSAQELFRKTIQRTAPNFSPFKRIDARKKHLSPAAFLRAEEGDEEEADFSGVDDENFTTNPVIYIDEVMERAQQARTRELPGHYPFAVQKHFIEGITREWLVPAQILCKTVHGLLADHVKDLITEHFGDFGQGLLEQRISTIVQQHMKKCLERTEERVIWLVKLEDLPFSLNTRYLSDYQSKFLSHYRSARESYEQKNIVNVIKEYNPNPQSLIYTSKGSVAPPTGVGKALAGLAEMGLSGVSAHDLAKLLPSDSMEPALDIMADVRAYFQVAYKRFADNVPLAIDLDLVRGAEQGVIEVLYSSLGINGLDGRRICQELAQESPDVAGRRLELQKKLERLEIACRELLSIGV